MSTREGNIKEKQWKAIRKLLDEAAKDDSRGSEIRDLFKKDVPKDKKGGQKTVHITEKKLKELKKHDLDEPELREIHEYLENIFHDSPLRFWWW